MPSRALCIGNTGDPTNKYVWTRAYKGHNISVRRAAGKHVAAFLFNLRKRRLIMKKGIFIAMAALGLALFAVPEAHGVDGQTLNMSISGGNHIASDMDGVPTPVDGQALTALQVGIAKGSGNPSLFSTATLQEAPEDPSQWPPDCPAQLPVGNDISVTIVFTYNDGSLLSVATEAGSFYCTDGVNFTVNAVGTVAGGYGRFEGAAGTWEATVQTLPGALFTGEVSVDLN